MIGSVAWSDLIDHQDQDPGRNNGRRLPPAICKVDGCKHLGTFGKGYCEQHARAYYRCGHPLGKKVKTREAMMEALIAWWEGPTPATERALLSSVLAWYAAQRTPPRTAGTADPAAVLEAGRRLMDADTDRQWSMAMARFDSAIRDWVWGRVAEGEVAA